MALSPDRALFLLPAQRSHGSLIEELSLVPPKAVAIFVYRPSRNLAISSASPALPRMTVHLRQYTSTLSFSSWGIVYQMLGLADLGYSLWPPVINLRSAR